MVWHLDVGCDPFGAKKGDRYPCGTSSVYCKMNVTTDFSGGKKIPINPAFVDCDHRHPKLSIGIPLREIYVRPYIIRKQG